jgi:hypothetical protein
MKQRRAPACRLRPLILAFGLLAATGAQGVEPYPAAGIAKESGAELLARCEPALRLLDASGGEGPSAAEREQGLSCIAFVDGFIWGHAWSAWRERRDMYYCPPEGFSARQGVPVVVDYLKAEPARQVQRAHLLVFAAFNRAWPCIPIAPAQ